jgi:hypothetical protein
MKKSSSVTAPLLASVALATLTSCRQPEMKRCVDNHSVVVDDSLCAAQPQPNQSGGYTPSIFHYYYGGFGSYTRGSIARGGGFSPAIGHSYASPTVRGGFGSSFSGGEGAGE